MPNLNAVQLMGNLTRDPELKYTPKGTAIAQIGLAINRKYSTEGGEKREETTFVDVELWGRTAELAQEYLKKGSSVYIAGRLKLDTWDDKATGQKRSKMVVVGENMQFLGGRDGGNGGGQHEERPAQRQQRTEEPQNRRAAGPPPVSQSNSETGDDFDVPF